MSRRQRNRCQYCRMYKCLKKGMNRKAIREDGMPGGRNKTVGPITLCDYDIERIMSGEAFKDKDWDNGSVTTSNNDESCAPLEKKKSPPPLPITNSLQARSKPFLPLPPLPPLLPPTGFAHPHTVWSPMLPYSRLPPNFSLPTTPRTSEERPLQNFSIPIDRLVALESSFETLSSEPPFNFSKEAVMSFLCKLADEFLLKQVNWVKKLQAENGVPARIDLVKLVCDTWPEITALCVFHHFMSGQFKLLSLHAVRNYVPSFEEIKMLESDESVASLVEKLMKTFSVFKLLQVSIEEYTLLKILLFTNYSVLQDLEQSIIKEVHNHYTMKLRDFIETSTGGDHKRFLQLMEIVYDLKLIGKKFRLIEVTLLPSLFKLLLSMSERMIWNYSSLSDPSSNDVKEPESSSLKEEPISEMEESNKKITSYLSQSLTVDDSS